ncbi:hypothetical protein K492DRAFT_235822 [Lichtheimia hyalospora FSU 10163]|nr:hypothetical protein K492DRAFT_235822 [Lichtheimia hyalospora FSU 10163]
MNNAEAAMIDMSPPYPCIKAEHDVDKTTSQQQLYGSREAMEPLYNQLLEPTFKDSASAVGFCRAACHQYGFTIKQETSANKHWPSTMNSLIVELARDRVPTHDIRTRVQQAYPNIAWNERRFYNRLTEERKRIRSRDILDRSRRLLLLLSRLTSLAAANEHWAAHVESEMARLFDSFCQAAHPHVDPDTLVVDLDPDQICHDKQQQELSTSTRNKKASNSNKELKIHIPSYTLAVTPQKFRQPSSSSPSSMLCNNMASASTIVTGATHSPSSSSLCPSEYAYNDTTTSSSTHQQSIAASFLSASPAETVTQALPFDFSSGMVLPKQPESMFLDYGLLQQHQHPQQHLQRLDDPLPQGPW